jgi:hypothetical protein
MQEEMGACASTVLLPPQVFDSADAGATLTGAYAFDSMMVCG